MALGLRRRLIESEYPRGVNDVLVWAGNDPLAQIDVVREEERMIKIYSLTRSKGG
jgi:hypothetical protein